MGLEQKHRGIVSEIGLCRDEESFRSFNLTIGVTMKIDKGLTYEEGERVADVFRKELLGKNIELGAITIPCTVCGKTFNTKIGMKQHQRIVHKNGEKPTKNIKKKISKKGSSKRRYTRV